MTIDLALGLMGGFLLLVAFLVSRIPVRCPHAEPCAVCEQEAREARAARSRLMATIDHVYHMEPVKGCPRCYPPSHDLDRPTPHRTRRGE